MYAVGEHDLAVNILVYIPKLTSWHFNSCGKVMFSQTRVKNSVHRLGGVGYVSQHAMAMQCNGVHPLGRHTPPPSEDTHRADTPH